ncbi:MAG TPA: LLM class flavin-dependent oxidoreductase [Candidatus Limnocylindrales bacterium]|nr:LLM class flavin-dependent oxidoreductase [Candidatus Limnocylindrales bacterium]
MSRCLRASWGAGPAGRGARLPRAGHSRSPARPAIAGAGHGGDRRGHRTAAGQRLCPDNDLRHPAVLAQDLASLDVLSEGRLDVAIGGGWNQAEYDAVGIDFEPAPIRSDRLAEAVAILKGCFGDGPDRSTPWSSAWRGGDAGRYPFRTDA